MDSMDHRPLRTAWIPWVIALVALFGVNALIPDQSRSRRNETSEEIGISQLADNAQAPGRITHPLIFLIPDFSGKSGFLSASSSILHIETRRDLPAVQSLEGAVQGRAPPVTAIF
jgi:hypothetical protein